jgi:hypothetical protein
MRRPGRVSGQERPAAQQPLPADVADALRAFLADRSPSSPVWPGTWHERAANMFRNDLAAAGIEYAVETPDGPLFADFHCTRHTTSAMLDRSGATLKMAMQIMRHSDPKLTAKRYGRAQLHDMAGAVDKLPSIMGPAAGPEESRATGTDGQTAARLAHGLHTACTRLAHGLHTACTRLAQKGDPW